MQVFDNIAGFQSLRKSFDPKLKIGFVPTMGNLHPGHASLVELSKQENDLTIVSILVNPTQFDNPNDFKFYPRTIEADKQLLTELKVDYCFMPNAEAMYADNYRYKVDETELSLIMEGAHRGSHFTGVLTVVMKLFNLVRPTSAYFGEKDYQQYLLIKDMVDAFFMDVKVHACQTIRESSTLALSSRNSRLNHEQLDLAKTFASIFHQPKTSEEIRLELEQVGIVVDYVTDWQNRRFAAVRIGEIRLIDNYSIG